MMGMLLLWTLGNSRSRPVHEWCTFLGIAVRNGIYLDVNRDGYATNLDIARLVQYITLRDRGGEAEGESQLIQSPTMSLRNQSQSIADTVDEVVSDSSSEHVSPLVGMARMSRASLGSPIISRDTIESMEDLISLLSGEREDGLPL